MTACNVGTLQTVWGGGGVEGGWEGVPVVCGKPQPIGLRDGVGGYVVSGEVILGDFF